MLEPNSKGTIVIDPLNNPLRVGETLTERKLGEVYQDYKNNKSQPQTLRKSDTVTVSLECKLIGGIKNSENFISISGGADLYKLYKPFYLKPANQRRLENSPSLSIFDLSIGAGLGMPLTGGIGSPYIGTGTDFTLNLYLSLININNNRFYNNIFGINPNPDDEPLLQIKLGTLVYKNSAGDNAFAFSPTGSNTSQPYFNKRLNLLETIDKRINFLVDGEKLTTSSKNEILDIGKNVSAGVFYDLVEFAGLSVGNQNFFLNGSYPEYDAYNSNTWTPSNVIKFNVALDFNFTGIMSSF